MDALPRLRASASFPRSAESAKRSLSAHAPYLHQPLPHAFSTDHITAFRFWNRVFFSGIAAT